MVNPKSTYRQTPQSSSSYAIFNSSTTTAFVALRTSPKFFPRDMGLTQSSSPSSVRCPSVDPSISPSHSISIKQQPSSSSSNQKKRTCSCAPTTHPRSYPCVHHRALTARSGQAKGSAHQALTARNGQAKRSPHRALTARNGQAKKSAHSVTASSSSSNFSSGSSLNLRRSALAHYLLRIGGAEGEGEWVKRALSALTRPSPSRHRRRRETFRPCKSRLSVMSTAQDF